MNKFKESLRIENNIKEAIKAVEETYASQCREMTIDNRKNDYQIVRLRAMNTKSLDIRNRLQEIIEEEQEGKIQYVNENDKIEGEEEFYE